MNEDEDIKKLKMIDREPVISIGLMTGVRDVEFELKGAFAGTDGARFNAGSYRATADSAGIAINDSTGNRISLSPEFHFIPSAPDSSFVIHDVLIGIDFHWERKEAEEFQGSLRLKLHWLASTAASLLVINEIGVESYLKSVISSEMSADAHPELLKAHSIISRSWLLAQLGEWKRPQQKPQIDPKHLIRWYDRENHAEFDFCAYDHCQRYHGIGKATSPSVFEAVRATSGQVLTSGGIICDARYSKSCGGMTESFSAAWGDEEVPYLAVFYDGESFPPGYNLPLSDETNAAKWIRNSPPAFCNTNDRQILNKILPDFDRETTDFYRWRVVLKQEELQELLRRKLEVDFGAILRLDPIERGRSGRIVKIKITGERETLIIGKELEIRRTLSPSHLYSSAFVVDADCSGFTLSGAGWGHGVGLCQIGAALMAERGYNYRQILAHYYRGTELQALYLTRD